MWRSLCLCLAETCGGVEPNQSYCTHLVPLCIQKCSQSNIEVFMVLQSLLQNHTRNISLFIECNGIMLFQREFLKHDDCLQLLCILVQSSTDIVHLITKTEICQHLRDFLALYGPQSQIGEWATVLLYHITGPKGSCEAPIQEYKTDVNKPAVINKTMPVAGSQYTSDTTRLFQNVMREILQCNPNELQEKQYNSFNRIFSQEDIISSPRQNIALKYNFGYPDNNVARNKGIRNSKANDLSFTFLQTHNNQRSTNTATKYVPSNNITKSFQEPVFLNNKIITDISSSLHKSLMRANINHNDSLELSNFEPKFVSTPKKYNKSRLHRFKREQAENSKYKSAPYSTVKHKIKRRIEKNKTKESGKILSRLEQSTDVKEKNRSMSGRFFEAINESCTALVKTVKNLFKPKVNSQNTDDNSDIVSDKNSPSCSYSFTNYMKKRDVILNKDCDKNTYDTAQDFSMEMSNSCNTCNDTLALKHKLAHDEYLKQTVRKLKLGINLYGCDFKKISKQLWPQQAYMTPIVLYNLYRKLIIK